MLTFWNKRVWFKVKFSDDKCVDFNKKDNGGDTGIDNENRIAGNMYPLNVYDLHTAYDKYALALEQTIRFYTFDFTN